MPNTCPSDEFAFIINYSSYCNSRISIWLKLICAYNSALRLDSVGGPRHAHEALPANSLKQPHIHLKPWPNDYTFLSTFAIHLYCKNLAMYCVVAKRLDISLYNLFDFPT